MEMTLIILVFLLEGLWQVEATSATGEVGEDIKITCSHVNAFDNVKYFCKGACKNEDILITSRDTETDSNGKYSLKDEGNTFYVTVTGLTEDDSGTYWCGIDRVGVDTYNKVVLTVMGNTKHRGNNLQQSNSEEAVNTSATSLKKLVYIGAGLGVAVLALVMVTGIFFRHRKRHISTTSGREHDTVYATPSIQKQDAHCDITNSSSNEDQATDDRSNSIFCPSSDQHQDTSRDFTDTIYSNVTASSEPHSQPDGLFYSTVSFNKHTDCSTATPCTATATYSSLKHTTDVYCNA